MPSSKDPATTVNPGAGRLPAGVVPAGAIIAPEGGGGGVSLATSIQWAGDGAWVDGTTNPATNVGSQLTKIIGDLTDPTSPHAASDKLSARTTTQTLTDGSTATGASIQALIENLMQLLAVTAGVTRIGASYTIATYADGAQPNAASNSLRSLLDAMITLLAQEINGTAASITVSGPTVTLTGLTGITPQLLGQNITIYNAANSGNNGTFPIASYQSGTSVTITNGSASTDPNNGSIVWAVSGGSDRLSSREIAAPFSGAPYSVSNGTLYSTLSSMISFVNARFRDRIITNSQTLDNAGFTDSVVLLDSTSASFNFSFTSASTAGRRFLYIIDKTGMCGTNPVYLTPNGGDLIDGFSEAYPLNAAYGRWSVFCDGTQWYVITG